ncbi:hypothetical protein L6164_007763 [Bauhinia variegata]|uniref:Uncharacterized protein n=1 Tax=Bauhinia variegata TaxID=167791 RepID=A0ACB9PDT0_BAUVA|nr:hypothetical protein L6164_007763 [Bauhinia variegata]
MEGGRVHVSFLVFLLSFIVITTHSRGHGSICPPEKHAALFVFGDSLFDAGNNNYINAIPFLLANYPPYGETFFKYPSGRFSDGRVIPDFIAEYAKLPLIPPYLHPDYSQLYVYGVNFASGGSGALVETRQGPVIDLKSQLNNFKTVKKQLEKELGHEEAKELVSKSVYIFSVGGNDYATPFLTNSSIPYPLEEFVDIVIGNITTVVKEIYKLGGRKFGFSNVAPLNCFPILRMLGNASLDSCQDEQVSVLAKLHNNAFTNTLEKLEKELKRFKYAVFDFHNELIRVMKYPSKYGFKEGEVACCGGGPYRGDYSCGGKRGIKEYELCENVSEHVFFDSIHSTDRASKHFAELFWSGNKYITKPYNLKALFGIEIKAV